MLRLWVVVFLIGAGTIAARVPLRSDADARFHNQIAKRIGPLWYSGVDRHLKELTPGTVRVELKLARDGRIVGTHVVSNTSDGMAARIALEATAHAKFPAVPAGLLRAGVYDTQYDFTVYEK